MLRKEGSIISSAFLKPYTGIPDMRRVISNTGSSNPLRMAEYLGYASWFPSKPASASHFVRITHPKRTLKRRLQIPRTV
jgi:hypothetical protein